MGNEILESIRQRRMDLEAVSPSRGLDTDSSLEESPSKKYLRDTDLYAATTRGEAFPIGMFGVGESVYDEGILPSAIEQGKLEQIRGSHQSAIAQFGGFLNQLVVGELIGGTVEGIGNLLDIDSYKQLVSDTEDDWGNAFSNLGRSIREGAKELTPIYQTAQPGEFAPGHWSWWMQNAVSVGSTLSLMIPAAGVIKGLSLFGKLTKVSKFLGIAGKGGKLAQGVGMALVSRHMENMMESKQTYDKHYQYLKDRGIDEIEAKREASMAAADVYDKNWVMVLQDLPQYLLFNGAFLSKSVANTFKTARAMGKSIPEALLKPSYTIMKDMFGEGVEEAYQYMVQEESRYLREVASGREDDSSFLSSGRLGKYLKSGDMWTSFMAGAIGAGIMQTAGKAVSDAIDKKTGQLTPEERRVKDINSWTGLLHYTMDELRRAETSGTDLQKEYAMINMMATAGPRAFANGNGTNLGDFFTMLENKPDERDKKTFNLEDEDIATFNAERLVKAKSELEKIGNIWEANKERLASGELKNAEQVYALTTEEYLVDKYNEIKNRFSATVQELKPQLYTGKILKNEEDKERLDRYITVLEDEAALESLNSLSKTMKKAIDKEENEEQILLRTAKKTVVDQAIEEVKKDIIKLKEKGIAKDPRISRAVHKSFIDAVSALAQAEQMLESSNKAIELYTKNPDFFKKKVDEAEDIIEDDNKSIIPEVGDLVTYQETLEDGSTVSHLGQLREKVLEEDDEEKDFLIDVIDAEGNILNKEGGPIKVLATNVKLWLKPNLDETDDGTETLDEDNDIPEEIRGGERLGVGLTQLVYSKSKGKKIEIFDPALDKIISNPNTNFDKVEAKFVISPADLKKIKGNNAAINQAYLYMSIGVEIYLNGKLISTEYKEGDQNIPVTIYSKNAKGLSKEEIKFRKLIIDELLKGNSVFGSKVERVNSGFYNSGHEQENIQTVFDVEPNEITYGVSKGATKDKKSRIYTESSKTWYGESSSPGSIYIYTDKTINKQMVPVRTNAQKLTPESAGILWDAIKIAFMPVAWGGSGMNGKFPKGYSRRKEGVENLNAGEVITFLALFGERKTSPDWEGGKHKAPEYLRNKQLFVKKGRLVYGENEPIILNPREGGEEYLKEYNEKNKQLFIEWAVANKNYPVTLDNTKATGFGLKLSINKPVGRKFRIGSINVEATDKYGATLVKNDLIKTDVRLIGSGKNKSITKSPIIAINNASNYIRIEKGGKVIVKSNVRDARLTPKEKVVAKTMQLTGKIEVNAGNIKDLPVNTVITYKGDKGKMVDFATISMNKSQTKKIIRFKNPAEYDNFHEAPIDSLAITKHLWGVVDVELFADLDRIVKEKKAKTPKVEKVVVEEVKEPRIVTTKPKVKTTKKTAPKPEPKVTPKEPAPSTNKPKFNFGKGNRLNRGRPAGEPGKPYIKQDWRKEVDGWLTKRLGKSVTDLVKKTDKLIRFAQDGRELFGQYSHDLILLYAGAEIGTIYHEAFHRVSLGYLTVKDRENLYRVSKIKYRMLTATDIQIEEKLAEEFRYFVLNQDKANSIVDFANKYESTQKAAYAIYDDEGGIRTIKEIIDAIEKAKDLVNPTVFGSIKQFFADLFDMIRSFFIGNTRLRSYDVDHLFNMIQEGKFKHSKVLNENKGNIGQNGVGRYAVKGGILEETNTGSQTTSVVNGLVYALITTNNISNLNNVKSIKWEPLIELINVNLNGEYDEEGNAIVDEDGNTNLGFIADGTPEGQHLATLYTEILNDLSKKDSLYIQLIQDKLRGLNIRMNLPENEEEGEGVEFDLGIERFSKASYEIDDKKNVLASIKFLLATLPMSSEVNDFTGMPEFVDFTEIWQTLKHDLQDTDNIEDMIEVLRSNSENFAYQELATILENKNPNDRAQFQTALTLHRHSYINIKQTTRKDKAGIDRVYFDIFDADVQRAVRSIANIWNNDMYLTNKLIISEYGKDPNIRVDRIEDIQIRYTSLVKEMESMFKKGNESFTETQIKKLKKKIIDLLFELGIDIDDRTIDQYMTNWKDETDNYDHEKALFNFIGTDLNLVFNKVLDELKIVDKTEINRLYGNEKSIKEIARLHAESHPELINDSILGPGNNMYFTYSLPSYSTDVVKNIRNDRGHLEKIYNGYYGNSLWAKKLLESDELRKKIRLLTFSGAFSGKSKEGTEYQKLAPIDDYLLKLQLVLEGKNPFPTMAEKKTYYILDGLGKFESKFTFDKNGTPIPDDNTVDQFYLYYLDEKERKDESIKIRDEYLKTYKEYELAKDEENIKILQGRLATLQDNMKINYHFVGKGIIKDSNGFLLPSAVWSEKISKDGKKTISGGNAYSFQHFKGFNNLPKDYPNTEKAIRKTLSTLLSTRVEEEIEHCLDLGILKFTRKGVLKSDILDDKSLDDYKEEYGTYEHAIKAIVGTYVINTMVNNIEVEKMFTGDPAFYESEKIDQDTSTNKIKRFAILPATGSKLAKSVPGHDSLSLSPTFNSMILNSQKQNFSYNYLWNLHVKLISQRLIEEGDTKEEAKKKAEVIASTNLKSYKETDSTDAQVYISPEMYRTIALRLGEWTDERDEAFELLESDKELTVEEESKAYSIVMGPLKLVYFNLQSEGRYNIPLYDKMSLATLFKRFVKGSHFEELVDRMQGKGKYKGAVPIHMVKFDSAVKVGASKGIDFYKNIQTKEVNDLSNVSITVQEFEYLRRQLIVEPHDVESTKVGTQFIKICMGDIFKDKQIYSIDGEKEIKGSDILNSTNNLLSELSRRGELRLNAFLGFVNNTLNKEKFVNYLKKELIHAGATDDIVESMKLDDNLDFYMNLDSYTDHDWIQSRIISLVNKFVIDRVLPGNQLVQMSNFGLRTKEESSELRFIDLDPSGKVVTAQCKVSINMFKSLIPKTKEYDTFEKQVQFLKDNNLDEIISYRIPTQGRNSIVVFKVKEFLENTLGDTIIVPPDFVTVTGSDFDIDKAYVVRYNYKLIKDENGKFKIDRIKYSQGNSSDDIKKRYRARVREEMYINRDLFEDDIAELKEIQRDLKDEDLNEDLLETLIFQEDLAYDRIGALLAKENILPLQKEFANLPLLEQNTEKAIQNRLMSTYLSVLLNKEHFVEATTSLGSLKDTLKGISKTVNKNRDKLDLSKSLFTITPSYQSFVKDSYATATEGIAPYALNQAHHVLSQMIDLKFKFPFDLGGNYNKETKEYSVSKIKSNEADKEKDNTNISSWLSVLIDAHVDNPKDPFISKLNVNDSTHNLVNLLIRSGFGEATFYFVSQPILFDYSKAMINSTSIFTKQTSRYKVMEELYDSLGIEKMDTEEFDNYFSKILDIKFLKETHEMDRDSEEFTKRQYVILKAFEVLNQTGGRLNSIVQSSRIDTKGFGKNIIEVKTFINKIKNVLNFEEWINVDKLFPFIDNNNNATKKDDSIFISNYAIHSLFYINRLMSNLTIFASPLFNHIADRIFEEVPSLGMKDKTVKIVYDEIFSAILGKFFVDKVKMSSKRLKNLLLDSENIVVTAKKFRKDPELQNNRIIKHIIPMFGQDDVLTSMFRIPIERITDKWEKDDIKRAWEELLSHEREDVRSFGKNLFVYCYYTSGFRRRITSFYEFTPTSLLKSMEGKDEDISLDAYIKEKLIQYQNSTIQEHKDEIDSIFETVLVGNWMDKRFVKEVPGELIIDERSKMLDDDPDKPLYLAISQDDDTRFSLSKYVIVDINNERKLFKRVGISKDYSGIEQEGDQPETVGYYRPITKKGYSNAGFVLIEPYMDKTILPTNSIGYKAMPEDDIVAEIKTNDPFFKTDDEPVILNDEGEEVIDITAININKSNVTVENNITFKEDKTKGYQSRTKKNASADATIAIAVDFNSAGEKLTKKSVKEQGKTYIPIDANSLEVTPERVTKIVELLTSVGAETLNIAGNGIYTMKGKYTQEQIDDFTYELLKAVTEQYPIKSIRTGGQTGFDEAGAKAGVKLGIPTTILAPKDWKFRDINGDDISDEKLFKERFGETKPEAIQGDLFKQPTEYKWARKSSNNYEVSSRGDKRFSAFYANLADGRSIEEAYQVGIKGYDSIEAGKGKPPIKSISMEDSWLAYKDLWRQYLKENPTLLGDLATKARGKVLTDLFAKTNVSQARALVELLNEGALNDITNETLDMINKKHTDETLTMEDYVNKSDEWKRNTLKCL